MQRHTPDQVSGQYRQSHGRYSHSTPPQFVAAPFLSWSLFYNVPPHMNITSRVHSYRGHKEFVFQIQAVRLPWPIGHVHPRRSANFPQSQCHHICHWCTGTLLTIIQGYFYGGRGQTPVFCRKLKGSGFRGAQTPRLFIHSKILRPWYCTFSIFHSKWLVQQRSEILPPRNPPKCSFMTNFCL